MIGQLLYIRLRRATIEINCHPPYLLRYYYRADNCAVYIRYLLIPSYNFKTKSYNQIRFAASLGTSESMPTDQTALCFLLIRLAVLQVLLLSLLKRSTQLLQTLVLGIKRIFIFRFQIQPDREMCKCARVKKISAQNSKLANSEHMCIASMIQRTMLIKLIL